MWMILKFKINRYRKLTQAGLLSIHFGNSHAIRFEKMDLDNRWLIGDIEEMLKEEIIPDVVFICQLEKTLESLTTNF